MANEFVARKGLIVSGSTQLTGSLTATGTINASGFSGSLFGTASITNKVTGGTENYIPLWTGASTLSSSLLFQTGSSLLLGATTQHTPEAPDRFGVFAGVTDSYNAVSVHGTTDNYFQINVKNFSTGPSASSDIVATTDSGTELFGYINMGINGTGYAGSGDSIGGADDAYLYMAGDGDLLIGNTSVDRRIILFSGAGSAISNARVFIDTQGFVGINTSTPASGAPEALAVQAIPESFNVINARASTNSYAQINLKNDSNGTDASSDIVATADNGTETANYINMGINSSQFTGLIGGPNDAYLYSTGSMLHIGNATPDNHIMFFAGGSDVELSRKLTLEANNNHTLTGSLNISGSIATLPNIINNLTASFAMTASYVSGAASTWDALTNKPSGLVSSSTQINTGSFSGSFTGTLLGTGSWANNAITASYALNAASTPIFPFTGSAIITGSLTVTGSVAVRNGDVLINNTVTNPSLKFADGVAFIHYAPSTQDFKIGTTVASTITFYVNQGSAWYIDGTRAFLPDANNTVDIGSSSNRVKTIWTTNISSSNPIASSSFATTASAATSITFTPASASFATTASFATSASYAPNTTFPYVGAAVITGSLTVTGSNGINVTGPVTIAGGLQATTKSFKIDHQVLLGKKLIYGVLEGKEHGVYVRGKLTNANVITLPEEWEWLVDADSITVQLTPIGKHQKLYIKSIENNSVTINTSNLLDTSINCFYYVQATRKDVAPLITVE
jgi:hypothetical protein